MKLSAERIVNNRKVANKKQIKQRCMAVKP